MGVTDPPLQLREIAVDVAGLGLRLGDGQMLKRKGVAGATLGQRVLRPGDDETVFGDARLRVGVFRRTEIDDGIHAGQTATTSVSLLAGTGNPACFAASRPTQS